MTKPIPDFYNGPIAHLTVSDGPAAIEFYKKAFGAQEMARMPAPDGKRIMYASVMINGAPVYLNDDFPEYCGGQSRTPQALGGSPVTIHQYVEDVDAAVEKAKAAGATVVMGPDDMFWGDRYALLTDPFGHSWALATQVKEMTPEEITKAGENAFG